MTSAYDGSNRLPRRKRLCHAVPDWVDDDVVFFITLCSGQRGTADLIVPAVAKALLESARHRHGLGQWWVHLVLVMPDHVHALATPSVDHPLEKVVSNLKRFVSTRYPIEWQRDFFDHRIRSDESLEEKWNYITQNPVRAGLVERPDDWPWLRYPGLDETRDTR